MDAEGLPLGIFAVNRWVTDESWYSAEDTIELLGLFKIEHANPNLFRPHIETLLRHRDQVITAWQENHPEQDVLEDRRLEITGYLPIDRHYLDR